MLRKAYQLGLRVVAATFLLHFCALAQTSTGAYQGSAGVITNTVTTSRQIQFGLKLIF